ncbi:hypothetical protein M0R45_018350 [Rubus argutus]|uniref:C2H2-type domain-containing protein n=1 Tax=Rubus argutus TaxID=59490 RepID=A0AAW1X3M0_RUBAR
MERNTSFCKRLVKDHNTVMTRAIDGDSTNNKKNIEDDEDYMNGYPWPPRSYTCSFCKREFKSAQALGGHMNVHRKDRARLRSSPPTDFIGQQLPTCSLPSWISPPSHSPPPTFSSPSYTCHSENMKWVVGGTLFGPSLNLETLDLSTQMTINAKSQEDGCMRLDLEIGVLGGHSKDDIDLELRLGYS